MRMKARGLHPGAGAEGSQPVLPGAGGGGGGRGGGPKGDPKGGGRGQPKQGAGAEAEKVKLPGQGRCSGPAPTVVESTLEAQTRWQVTAV
eukprot:4854804-Pyramimonas_sp.AAC.1